MEARPESTHMPRFPAFLALGEFRAAADQPVWFSASKMLMDTAGVGVDGVRHERGGGRAAQTGIGIYTSFTTRKGNHVLWYPDRKCFLLGRRITPQFLADLKVP
jgi:hypothetical protein